MDVLKLLKDSGMREEHLDSLVTHRELAKWMTFVTDKIGETAIRVKAIEDRGIAYKGVWQRAQEYTRGQVVTHKGSAWIVVSDQAASDPGESADWQLMVRCGRDANKGAEK